MDNTNTIWLGIDPGACGGLAALGSPWLVSEASQYRLSAVKMPETEADIWDWFIDQRTGAESVERTLQACIEWIHPAIQGVGKSSMSKLYGSYMRLRAFLTAAEIPFSVPQPKIWQREVGISARKSTETQSQWKNRLKARAQQLFPSTVITLATADAILIAEYCRRTAQ